MKTIILLIAVLGLLSTSAIGQILEPQVIGTIGGSFSNGSIDLNFTGGEAIITTETTAQLTVTQGFQQPYLGIVHLEEIDYSSTLLLFPNPALSEVNISLKNPSAIVNTVRIEVHNMQGELVMQEAINGLSGNNIFTLNIDKLVPGQYLLRLTNDQHYLEPICFSKM